jgi:hypothetical protein
VTSGLKKNVISLLVLFVIFLFSCQKEEEEAVILLTPFDIYIKAEPSEVISLGVTCQSPSEMREFIITSRIVGSNSRTELDTLISGRNFSYTFEYLIPELIENSTIFLEFTLIDAESKSIKNARIVEVITTTRPLVEYAGQEMFSASSGRQSGYNLLTRAPLFTHLTDSSLTHIADTSDTDALLKRWVSPAGLKFVKFAGFDYANCTELTARDAFNAGIKFDFINNIAEGDILITKILNTGSTNTYVVIKIMYVLDNPGSATDRYIFNIKE